MRPTVPTNTAPSRSRRTAGALVALALGTGVLAGCADDAAGPDTAPEAQAAQEPEASDVSPLERYVGQRVTVTGEVEGVLAQRAYTIEGVGDSDPDTLLVIGAEAGAPISADDAVATTGTVQQVFDIEQVEARYGFDYDDGLFDDYGDQPYIVAESTDTTVAAPATTTIEPAS